MCDDRGHIATGQISGNLSRFLATKTGTIRKWAGAADFEGAFWRDRSNYTVVPRDLGTVAPCQCKAACWSMGFESARLLGRPPLSLPLLAASSNYILMYFKRYPLISRAWSHPIDGVYDGNTPSDCTMSICEHLKCGLVACGYRTAAQPAAR